MSSAQPMANTSVRHSTSSPLALKTISRRVPWMLRQIQRIQAVATQAQPMSVMKEMANRICQPFADIGAFHAAILDYWREVAAEQVIAAVEAEDHEHPLPPLLRRAFSGRLALEKAVRSWATSDPTAREAVQAIDRRRLDYIEAQLRAAGVAGEIAPARAQILYWAFIGHALADRPLPKARREAVIDELIRIASRQGTC